MNGQSESFNGQDTPSPNGEHETFLFHSSTVPMMFTLADKVHCKGSNGGTFGCLYVVRYCLGFGWVDDIGTNVCCEEERLLLNE